MHTSIDVYRSDAFEWLGARERNSIHAIVTDPPYGVVEYLPQELKKRKENKGIWRIPRVYNGHVRALSPRFTVLDERDHAAIGKFYRRFAASAFSAIVPGGHVIVASQVLLSHNVIDAFLKERFELRGQLARLVRTLRGGDRPKGAHEEFPDVSVIPRSCWEPWLIFRRPCEGTVSENLRRWGTGALRRPFDHVPFTDLVVAPPARGLERRLCSHPSLKPQLLMRQLVFAALPLGRGVIVDPFMGGGSTVAAAQALGLSCIGIEANVEYFRLAKKAIPKLAALEVKSEPEGRVSVPWAANVTDSVTKKRAKESTPPLAPVVQLRSAKRVSGKR